MPVSIGGCMINPGDIVVGDEDGVVAFPLSGSRKLLSAVEAHLVHETQILKSIADGTYKGAYGIKAKP